MQTVDLEASGWPGGGDMAASAIAGLVAALTAAVILHGLQSLRSRRRRRAHEQCLRDFVKDGRRAVFAARDWSVPGWDETIPASTFRAARYNAMCKRLKAELDHWTPELTHSQRKDLLDAVSWYPSPESPLIVREGDLAPVLEIPEEGWPLATMNEQQSVECFARLEAIKWLRLGPAPDEATTR